MNSVEYSPIWLSRSISVIQKIPRLLWKSKVHYRVHEISPQNPTLYIKQDPTLNSISLDSF